MRRNSLLLFVLVALVLTTAPSLTARADEAAPAETATAAPNGELSPAKVPELFPELYPDAQPMGCTFCNPSGYLVCQTADGTACSLPGQNRRCIVSPVCYCEWGVCLCDGATGTWNCYW